MKNQNLRDTCRITREISMREARECRKRALRKAAGRRSMNGLMGATGGEWPAWKESEPYTKETLPQGVMMSDTEQEYWQLWNHKEAQDKQIAELKAENKRLKEELFEAYMRPGENDVPRVITVFGIPFTRVWELLRESGDI